MQFPAQIKTFATPRSVFAGLVAICFALSIAVYSAQFFCAAPTAPGALRGPGQDGHAVFLKEDVEAFISGATDHLRLAPSEKHRAKHEYLDLQAVSRLVNDQLATLEEQNTALKSERYALECKDNKAGVTSMGAWCAIKFKGHVADKLAEWLVDKFLTGKTVGDFGAGRGFYSQYFKDSGKVARVDAFDGAVGVEEASEGLIRYRDLSVPIRVSSHVPVYDYALSIEVGEHIPKDRESTFIDNLTNHAREGVILSWAIPGQGGKGHINEQPNAHIIEQMKLRGFEYDQQASLEARALDLHTTPWLKKTLMVFVRKQ